MKSDNLIMESIKIRHENYKDRTKLEELEKINYSKVSEKNIRTILMKKINKIYHMCHQCCNKFSFNSSLA